MKIKMLPAMLAGLIMVSCASTGKLKYMELHSRECTVCNRMTPIIEALGSKYSGKVDVESYLDKSDTGAEYIAKYNVRKYPANIFFDPEGKIFFRYEGLLDQKSIEEILDKKIKSLALTETAK